MPLAQLIYISRRAPELSAPVLNDIVAKAAIKNLELDITGVVMCCGESLMQLIEGEESDLDALFAIISGDHRHTDIQSLLRKQVQRRLFPEWSMELADIECQAPINRKRLQSMIEDVRQRTDTSGYSVESRMLLNDFRLQVSQAA
jgi:hypothetical protein